MIVKSADDKSKRIGLLTDLQKSPMLDARQRDWLRDELMRLKRGIQGERDAAFYIDSHFKDSENNAVLHDLRISVEGEVAQIDHLIINRMMKFYLLETKCFNGNVQINDRGEFTVSYSGERTFGVESPLEQSRRHERILSKLLEKLEITGRMGMKAEFFHAVLLHPKSIITRPEKMKFDTDDVFKADQIGSWYQSHSDRTIGVVSAFAGLLNVHSPQTTKEWAEKLARQHRPTDPLDLPDFMKPKDFPVSKRVGIHRAAVVPAAVDAPARIQSSAPPEELRKKLVCITCRQKITFSEGKFCWGNEARFGGFQYCREHQAPFK
ncbi:nuclease-related domain-containing protein [Ideonella alba]|uniref:NERD domain-containing protein n=1 Tax=Ideonella alba TaxID=2824118 RepID=A0A940YA93_9BURK|nr:nuclease-related domain-containing protein [Ideonella alba]MBQ0929037.1 NERD domain-containing protein [Ideonella alba]